LQELLEKLLDIPRDNPKYTDALAEISDHMMDMRMLLSELSLVDGLKYATDGVIRLRDVLQSNRLMWRSFEESAEALSRPSKYEEHSQHLEFDPYRDRERRSREYRRLIDEAVIRGEPMLDKTRTLEQKAYFNLQYVSSSAARMSDPPC
jgi:hypothetical protein